MRFSPVTKLAFAAILSAFSFWPCTAKAQDQMVSGMTAMALDAFYGACVTETFSIEYATKFIDELGWPEMDAAALQGFVTPEPQEYLRGWVATSFVDDPSAKGMPFFLVFGRPAENPQQIETCSAFFRFVDGEEFVSIFIEETGAVEMDRSTGYGATIVSMTLPDNPDILVSIRIGSRPGAKDVTASTVHMNQTIAIQ